MGSSVETPPVEDGQETSGQDTLSQGDGLTSQDVRTRAVRGATMFIGRDVAVQFIGFLTGLVLARLLSPSDFGITTLGLTISSAASVIFDGGIAASLISRKEPPTPDELRAVNGFQLAITLTVSAIAIPLGFAIGGDGPATAIILLCLPLYALRTPPMLVLERRLQFGPRIVIQVAELVTYGVVAIGLALLGLGVWAMPIALVARAAAGTLYCYILVPTGWLVPSLRFRLVRPLLGFGVRFQAKSLVQLARDLAVVSLVGSFGGFVNLGYYGMCIRLLSIPKTAASALGEVTFPAFSRLLGNGEDVGPILKRTTMTSALINALLIAPAVAASTALISVFFGHRWADASLALPGLGIALIVGGPVGWNIVNYLYATGDARTPLVVSGILNGIATIVLVAVGVKFFGLFGLGMGMAVAQLLTTPQLLVRVQRRGGPNLWRACLAPATSAAVSIAIGWWVCWKLGDTLVSGIASFTTALVVQVVLVYLTDRSALHICWATMKRAAVLTLPERLRPQRSPNKKNPDTEGVGLERTVDQAPLKTSEASLIASEASQRTSVDMGIVPSRPGRRGRRRRERYDREPLRDRLLARIKPDRRTYRYRREPLLARMRASVAMPHLHRPSVGQGRHRARHTATELGFKLRNRGWIMRLACAGAAIALLALLISSHNSPSQPQALQSNGSSASASASGSQGTIATPATTARRSSTGRRHVQSTAHKAKPAAPAVHHPTHVARQSTTTHPSTTTSSHTTPTSSTPTTTTHANPSPQHQSTTPTTPAPKQTAPTKPKQPSKPTSAPNPCSSSGVTCQGGLIFGNGAATIATAPAIGIGAYQNQGVGTTTLSQVISRFGAPLSSSALKSFIGAGSYSSLIGAQPPGDSCAYYLDSADRASRAFQLCFNSSHSLAAKAIISTSGAGSGSA